MRWKTMFGAGVISVSVALALGACGADTSDTDGGVAAGSGSASATVSVQDLPGVGNALTDPDGMTLYFTEQEADGTIRCQEGCVSFWKPLTVSSGATPTADVELSGTLATVNRPDGSQQVTFDGKPLYVFAQDSRGEAKGDGFKDKFGGTELVWHVAALQGAAAPTGSAPTSVPPMPDDDYGYGY